MCSIPFGWLTQTTVVSWDMCVLVCIGVCVCVCMWKRETALIFTQAVLGLDIFRHGEGREKHRDSEGESKGEENKLCSYPLGSLEALCTLRLVFTH